MKRIRLILTGVGEQLKDTAVKKLEKETSVPRITSGHTREFYEDLNIPENKIPKELLEREKESEKGVELDDEDYEEVHSEIMVYLDQIKLMVEDDELTTIFLEGDLRITVLESVDDIDNYINFVERTWWEGVKGNFSVFFRRIKWKYFARKEIKTEK